VSTGEEVEAKLETLKRSHNEKVYAIEKNFIQAEKEVRYVQFIADIYLFSTLMPSLEVSRKSSYCIGSELSAYKRPAATRATRVRYPAEANLLFVFRDALLKDRDVPGQVSL
jgi:hypothetical protein